MKLNFGAFHSIGDCSGRNGAGESQLPRGRLTGAASASAAAGSDRVFVAG